MKSNFTQNDLIKKLYNELEPIEELMLDLTLDEDWKLKEGYMVFKEVKNKLNSAKYTPSRTSIDLILAHSRKTAPMETSC